MSRTLPWDYHRALGQDGHDVALDTAQEIVSEVGVDAHNDRGDTPLSVAARLGRLEMVEWLLETGADPDFVPEEGDGHTPLHEAAEQNRAEVVRRLLEAGANVAAQNDRENTPLAVAFINTFDDPLPVAKALIDHGAPMTENARQNGLRWDAEAFCEWRGIPVPPAAEEEEEEVTAVTGLAAGYNRVNVEADDLNRWLWERLVPRSGPADTVQGELRRAAGNLRDEALRNGNANWSDIHEEQRRFLKKHLSSSDCLTEQQRRDVRSALRRLADHEYPYIKDDLYDFLEDCVVMYCRAHPELIPLDGPDEADEAGSAA